MQFPTRSSVTRQDARGGSLEMPPLQAAASLSCVRLAGLGQNVVVHSKPATPGETEVRNLTKRQMRVAFDVDGVVADLRSVLVREAEVLFGRALSIAPDVDEDHPLEGLNHRERQRLWRRIATIENFWETLRETEEGAVARIAAVASTRR